MSAGMFNSKYLPELADADLLRSLSYIGGRWTGAADSATFKVNNPADNSALGEVASLSSIDSKAAVNAAHHAFGEWSSRLPQARSAVIRRWFELIIAHKEDLAHIMTLEQGKPISESRGEIDYAASFVEFYAEEAKRPNIESVTSHLPDAEVEVWREPVGMAALVTPWNFPCAMLTRKAAAALAAGCTVVAHPSAETPYSALALAELAERAGFPAGVFNVVTGDAATVVGVDVSDHMLAESASNCVQRKVENVSFVKSDDDLTQLQGSFDLVHSCLVLQHIPTKRGMKLIEALLRHLQPGGVVAIQFYYRCDAPKWIRALVKLRYKLPIANMVRNILRGQSWREPAMQLHTYSLEEITSKLKAVGANSIYLHPFAYGEFQSVALYAQKAKESNA